MKLNRVVWGLLVLVAALCVSAFGRQSAIDLNDFQAVKARADHGDPDAQVRLAEMYASGDGVEKDPAKAAKWHRKAAELGSPRGQCLLGLDYAEGIGVKKNMIEALRWLRKSADQGWPSAQFDLGMCYAMGKVPDKSAVDAVVWYRKAADQGLPDAESALGTCYLDGIGVPKDIPEGLRWIRRAAEKGYAPAQQTLGICYSKGRGVPQDYVQAYKWLDLAAAKDDQNTDDIKVNLSMAERFMTPEQIAEGQRLAREFKPQNATTGPRQSSAPNTPTASSSSTPQTALTNTGSAVSRAPSVNGGVVIVKTDDESCDVFVDGKFVGNPPAKVKLAEGSHVIEVRKTGFKDYRKQLSVADGSELTLRAVLEKQ
jgi:hypothetical protein